MGDERVARGGRLVDELQHGAGLGWFSLGGGPVRDRAPLAAFENADFDLHGRNAPSHAFVTHVRGCFRGRADRAQVAPVRDERPAVRAQRGGQWARHTQVERAHVSGESDSELVFASVTAQILCRGDTTAGIIEAVRRGTPRVLHQTQSQIPVRVGRGGQECPDGWRLRGRGPLSSGDTPFTTKKTSFGRISGDSRGIDGVIRGMCTLGRSTLL